jgi:NADH-quinone oxidoreductase subunit M
VVLGDLIKESLKSITDMAPREKMIFAPLVAITLILGVYPALILDIIGPSVAALVETYHSNVAAHGIVSSAASTASH